jgi:hypothetical protein
MKMAVLLNVPNMYLDIGMNSVTWPNVNSLAGRFLNVQLFTNFPEASEASQSLEDHPNRIVPS